MRMDLSPSAASLGPDEGAAPRQTPRIELRIPIQIIQPAMVQDAFGGTAARCDGVDAPSARTGVAFGNILAWRQIGSRRGRLPARRLSRQLLLCRGNMEVQFLSVSHCSRNAPLMSGRSGLRPVVTLTSSPARPGRRDLDVRQRRRLGGLLPHVVAGRLVRVVIGVALLHQAQFLIRKPSTAAIMRSLQALKASSMFLMSWCSPTVISSALAMSASPPKASPLAFLAAPRSR